MRLLIAGVNYRPEVTGIGPYTAGLAEHLVRQGHEVLVSTTFPHYPYWRWQVPMAWWRRTEWLDGVEVRRMRVILPRRATRNWRMAYDTSFAAVTLVNGAMVSRPDLVLCVSPPIQTVFPAALLARHWGVPLVLLLKDLPLEAAVAVGMMRRGTAYRIGEWLERKAYARADRIVVINSQFRRSLADVGVPAPKVMEIPDWVDIEQILPSLPEQEMRELLGATNGEFVVLHAGNMGEKQGLSTAIQAAVIASRSEPIRLALVGEGQQKQVLERTVVEGGISSVRLLPLQPASVFPKVLAAADALLLNQRADVLDSVVPSKLLSYMAAARPIVAAAHPQSVAAHLVREAGCGVVVRPEDPEALANAIRTLSTNAGRRRALGIAGRHFVERRYEKNAILGSWESLLRETQTSGSARKGLRGM